MKKSPLQCMKIIFISKVIPETIKASGPLELEAKALDESELIASMRETITRDIHHQVYRLIGHLIPDENLTNWNDLADAVTLWNRIRNKCTAGKMEWDTNSKQYEFSQ